MRHSTARPPMRTMLFLVSATILAGCSEQTDISFVVIVKSSNYAQDTDRDRSYTTALNVLMLEVYYRYLTPFLEASKAAKH